MSHDDQSHSPHGHNSREAPLDGGHGGHGQDARQAPAIVLSVMVGLLSYFGWQTPTSAVQDKVGIENWVRYASLDVDNAVADQVRRDKERLVYYRALTRGGR